jgi:anti-anti-sigma regulatory factor
MYKALEDKSNFVMTGVSEEVKEILETSGFDQFFIK